ncbi:MAG: hypothetical protein Q8Q39_00030 [bacterium]|nr:hypothetical protein [bacterium]
MQKYVALIIIFLVLLAAAVSGLVYVFRNSDQGPAEEVALQIIAPQDITSGDEVAFEVKWHNGTRVPLHDAKIFFRYPDGAIPLERPEQLIETVTVGTIAPSAEGSRIFKGYVVGAKSSIVRASAELAYKSAGIAEFRKVAETSVRIADASFFLDFVVPQRAVSGERIVYFLRYENLAVHPFGDVRVRVRYPDGFAYGGAEPAATEGSDTWDLGEVAQGGKGLITISGFLEGMEGDTKRVKAEIGFMRAGQFFPYTESSFDTIVAPPPLAIQLELDSGSDVANLGQTLNARLRFKNNTQAPIKEVVVRAVLEGNMFIPRSVSAERGYFDSTRNMLIWTPANVKQLAFLDPGIEQTLTFRLTLRDDFPITEPGDTNFTARIVGTVESIHVPPDLALNKITSSDTLQVKLQTEMDFSAWGRYYDDSSGIVNSGPIPPRVNQETKFTMHWRIAVPANDLENFEVRATLPTGVYPTGEVVTRYTDARPTFNVTTGEVVWFISRVPANTGILYPAYEAIFQVGMVPSVTQIGQGVELMRESRVGAADLFTGNAISAQAPPVRSDQVFEQSGQADGRVQP